MTQNEPVVAGVSIIAIAQAVIAVLTAFGIGLTNVQTGAIEGLVVLLAPVVAFLVRQHVTPSHKVVTTVEPVNPFLPSTS